MTNYNTSSACVCACVRRSVPLPPPPPPKKNKRHSTRVRECVCVDTPTVEDEKRKRKRKEMPFFFHQKYINKKKKFREWWGTPASRVPHLHDDSIYDEKMTKLTGEQEPNHKNKTQTRAHTHTPTLNPPPPPPPPITGDLFFPRFVSFIHQRICVCVFDYYVTVVAVIKNIVSFFFTFSFFSCWCYVCVCVCVCWAGRGRGIITRAPFFCFYRKNVHDIFFIHAEWMGGGGGGG